MESGFTLMELLVALALAAIISMSIMVISTQARMAYQETVKQVDVYGRFRYMLSSIEEDLRNWIPTGELEFYQDGASKGGKLNGHWDPGEEVQDRSDEHGKGVIDGGRRGKYDEFASIVQRHYVSRELEQRGERIHDAYQLYLQTYTYVAGAVRLANVEYILADPDKPRVNGVPQPPTRVDDPRRVADLTLFKVIRYYDVSPRIVQRLHETPVRREIVEVASNVTDFRVEYSAAQREGVRSRQPIFMTPEDEYKSFNERAVRPRRENESGLPVYRKLFGYGSVDLNENYPLATAYSGFRGDDQQVNPTRDHRPVRFGFQGQKDIGFAQLVPGDRIYIFTGADVGSGNQTSDGGFNVAQELKFPTGDYTVKTNLDGLLELVEDVDSTFWNGQNQSGLYYKAPYLPSAVRITIRVVNNEGQSPKTMQRVIWMRRRSR